jgi:hypothetical protein
MGAEERQIVALDVVKTWSLHPRKSCARSYRCRQHFVDQLERWESLLSALIARTDKLRGLISIAWAPVKPSQASGESPLVEMARLLACQSTNRERLEGRVAGEPKLARLFLWPAAPSFSVISQIDAA